MTSFKILQAVKGKTSDTSLIAETDLIVYNTFTEAKTAMDEMIKFFADNGIKLNAFICDLKTIELNF